MVGLPSPLELALLIVAALVAYRLAGLSYPGIRGALTRLVSTSSTDSVFTDLLPPVTVLILFVYVGFWFHTNLLRKQTENAEQQAREMREKAGTLRQQVETSFKQLRSLHSESSRPQLAQPAPDLEVIGTHVDASWVYDGHSEFSQYVVDLIGPSGERALATDAASETTRFPSNVRDALKPGQYWWRVGVLNDRSSLGSAAGTSSLDDASSPDWSTYRSFHIYGSIRERVRSTKRVLVGTNFLQATQFSRRRPKDGRPEGFEIELIKAVIEGCITIDSDTGLPRYDAKACEGYIAEIPENEDARQETRTTEGFRADILPVGHWDKWEERVLNREVDLFIGEVTRTREREDRGLVFASGYYGLYSRLVIPSSQSCQIDDWLQTEHALGAIKGSTNADLARRLQKQSKSVRVLDSYESYPSLENAMEHHEVDSMMVDEPLAAHRFTNENGIQKWRYCHGLEGSRAYRDYLTEVIGCASPEGCREQFAVAAAAEPEDSSERGEPLIRLIQQALNSESVRRYASRLRCSWLKEGCGSLK